MQNETETVQTTNDQRPLRLAVKLQSLRTELINNAMKNNTARVEFWRTTIPLSYIIDRLVTDDHAPADLLKWLSTNERPMSLGNTFVTDWFGRMAALVREYADVFVDDERMCSCTPVHDCSYCRDRSGLYGEIQY